MKHPSTSLFYSLYIRTNMHAYEPRHDTLIIKSSKKLLTDHEDGWNPHIILDPANYSHRIDYLI